MSPVKEFLQLQNLLLHVRVTNTPFNICSKHVIAGIASTGRSVGHSVGHSFGHSATCVNKGQSTNSLEDNSYYTVFEIDEPFYSTYDI